MRRLSETESSSTSKYCRRCDTRKHPSEFAFDRSASDKRQGYCRVCRARISSEWGKRNKRERTAYTLKWSRANPDKIFNNYLRHSYGISRDQYNAMLAEQGSVCALCHRPETLTKRGKVTRLAVDHCHETDIIRGLLCSKCNNGLGHFEDEPSRLRAAADYIEKRMAAAMMVA